MINLFNSGNKWHLQEHSKLVRIEVFFRGIGGTQDCVLAMAKLAEEKLLPLEMVMVDGYQTDELLLTSGEASLGLTYALDTWVNGLNEIVDCLLTTSSKTKAPANCWLKDFNQYEKIQLRYRVADGAWCEWQTAKECV